MEPKTRGRGVGRGRGQAAAQRPGGLPQQQPPQPQPQPQRPPPPQEGIRAIAPQQAAWVRPGQPGATQAWGRTQPAVVAPPQAQQGLQVAGRGASVAGTVTGGGDGAQALEGRGGSSVRGRVVNRNEIIYTRPPNLTSKSGSTGNTIKLQANYLPLLHTGKWSLYQYRVDVAPEIDSRSTLRTLVRTAMQPHLPGGFLFDGTVLYATIRLNPDIIEAFAQENDVNYRVTVKLVGEVAWGDYHYIQVFNIIVHKVLKHLGLQLVGRNYYSPENRIVVQEHRIQLWPGYSTSMRQHERNILLNVDHQFKFMRTDNVYDMLMECNQSDIRTDFGKKLVGSVVLTSYNNKTYRIDDVDFDSSPSSTFPKRDGSHISYVDYYSNQYGIRIRDTNQPMLISRSKPREIRAGMPETVYLVPELCQLTGLTDRQRENFHLMQALAIHTRVAPARRIEQLLSFARQIQSNEEVVKELKRWDLSISNALVQFTGRILPSERILASGNDSYSSGQQADWTRDVRSKPMFFAGKMERLAVICPKKFKQQTQEFVTMLGRCASGMRWNIGTPRIFEIPDDRSGTYVTECERIINTAHPTMILIILSTNSSDRYSAIKKKCYVDRGVPTQLIVARNLTSKGVMSIATKVAIQMNAKIGGAPWSVSVPLSGLMVVGYDVCRDTINKKKSFAGMVATLDKQLTRYYSFVAEHSMEEELSNNFAGFMIAACKKYFQVNGSYPDRILIFRDGVGEGQLPFVIEHEVANIKKKLKDEIYKDALKLAFVIVSKRLNTRIYADGQNPPPGTVVDDVITLPERYDFFIVSQCVRQGTVGPTSYNVIEDTIGLPPDKMQILTYKMTHMYYNWSGTVKVPAPCQYAHKLSFLTAQSLHRPAHSDLSTLLYYL